MRSRSGIVPIYRLNMPLPQQTQVLMPQETNAQLLTGPGMPVNPTMPTLYFDAISSNRDVQTASGAAQRGQAEANVFNAERAEAAAVTNLANAIAQLDASVGEMQLLETQFSTAPAAAPANLINKQRIGQLAKDMVAILTNVGNLRQTVETAAAATEDQVNRFAQLTAA